MKYEHTAKGIAALGRNGDDTLMHVNKDELAGLQALLGPVTVNPETGLPEAFKWTKVLGMMGLGLAGAFTGGATEAALGPALGLEAGGLGGTALATGAGAGVGALGGGTMSALQGKGFGPGALGGAISGGMGGFGGSGMGEAAAKPAELGITTAPEEALKRTASSKVWQDTMLPGYDVTPEMYKQSAASFAEEPTLSSFKSAYTPSVGDAFKNQAGAMFSKQGVMDLVKPIGLGTMLGTVAEEGRIQAQEAKQAEEQQQAIAQANAQDQQNYFSSLGFTLPSPSAYTSPYTSTQRDYFLNLLYPNSGYAAGGPVTASRLVAGVPVQTTFPAKYVDEFERSDPQKEVPEAFQGLQQLAGQVGLAADKSMMRRMAHGGYLNNTLPVQEDPHPQSYIPKAQPHPGASPVRQEVVQNYADGGGVYEEGGFLDGPGDGMSDDIPANIDGQEEVRLADGEFVIPPEVVRMLGYGDPQAGAKLLDKLLPMVREAAHGKKEQVKKDAGKKVVEKALGGLPQQGKKSLAAEKAEQRKARG